MRSHIALSAASTATAPLMADRLPAHLEAAGLIRQAEAEGGFGTILKRGDPDRGALS